MMTFEDRRERALRLLDEDKAVVPIQPKSKMPAFHILKSQRGTKSWKAAIEDKPFDAEEVAEWFVNDPDINVGFVPSASNCLVLDFDDVDVLINGLGRELFDQLPATYMEITGRGVHLEYDYSGEKTSGSIFWKGQKLGEILYDTMVVCAPSIHESGKLYISVPGPRRSPIRRDYLEHLLRPPIKKEEQHPNTPSTQHLCTSTWSGLSYVLGSDSFVMKVADLIGVPIKNLTEVFICLYHPNEKRPSANFRQTPEGYLYRCWHDKKWVKLGQLYHDHTTGYLLALKKGERPEFRNISKVESTLWLIRLAHDLGEIELPPSFAVPLPESFQLEDLIVYEAIDLVSRCRRYYEASNTTFPATKDYISRWCGRSVTADQVFSSMRRLKSHNYIAIVVRGKPHAKEQVGSPTIYRLGTLEEIGETRGGD